MWPVHNYDSHRRQSLPEARTTEAMKIATSVMLMIPVLLSAILTPFSPSSTYTTPRVRHSVVLNTLDEIHGVTKIFSFYHGQWGLLPNDTRDNI